MKGQWTGKTATASRPYVVGRSRTLLLWTICSMLYFGFSACFDPKESCLDVAATNFNADADKNCCCKYPKLQLSVDQTYGIDVYRQDSLFAGANGHLFRIKSIAWYLSDFQLFRSSETFPIGDSLDFKLYEPSSNDTISKVLTDDATLIRRTPLVNDVGSFREDGFFDKIRFRLGLNGQTRKVIPALAPAGHPLRPQSENLYRNGDYVLLQAVVVRDSMAATMPDTLNFFYPDFGDFFIEGTGQFEHPIGYNFTLTLKADWKAMFDGVIWTNYDPEVWKTRIVANMPSVFSVTQ